MARQDKLIERFKARPVDFTWPELERLLAGLGYTQVKTGKAGGSRRRFVHPDAPVITLHEPHPRKILKAYQVRQVLELLEREGLI
jgi:predicted RNA binding protein YcfA (HicA-like mRNA interferase family)